MNAEASGTGKFITVSDGKLAFEVQFHIGPFEFEVAILKEELLCCKKQAPLFFCNLCQIFGIILLAIRHQFCHILLVGNL